MHMPQQCPRCHFEQPEDRYCANCGLDITTFQPKKLPIYSRIWMNSNFQLSALGALLVITVGYLYIQSGQMKRSEVNYQEMGLPTGEDDPLLQNEDVQETTSNLAVAPEPSEAKEPTSAFKSQGLVEDEPAAITHTKLKVYFIEAPNSFFQEVSQKGSEKKSGFHAFTGDIESLFSTHRVQYLAGQPNGTFDVGSPIDLNFNVTSEDGEKNEGFDFQLTSSSQGEKIKLQIRGQISLATNSDDPINATVDFNDSVEANQVLILSSIVPRQKLLPEEAEAYSDSPLSIYNSDEFLNSQSDFHIIIVSSP